MDPFAYLLKNYQAVSFSACLLSRCTYILNFPMISKWFLDYHHYFSYKVIFSFFLKKKPVLLVQCDIMASSTTPLTGHPLKSEQQCAACPTKPQGSSREETSHRHLVAAQVIPLIGKCLISNSRPSLPRPGGWAHPNIQRLCVLH